GSHAWFPEEAIKSSLAVKSRRKVPRLGRRSPAGFIAQISSAEGRLMIDRTARPIARTGWPASATSCSGDRRDGSQDALDFERRRADPAELLEKEGEIALKILQQALQIRRIPDIWRASGL